MSEIKVNSVKGVGASTAAITINNSDGTCTANVSNNLGSKNFIINGGHEVAQRGTAQVVVDTTVGYRSVDRFKTDIDGSGVTGRWSHGQSTDVPANLGFRHSSKILTTTVQSQPSGSDVNNQFYYMLEKQDVTVLRWGSANAKTCTLSFYVKGSVTGTYALWLQWYGASDTDYFYYTSYTIDSANTWERKTITITGPTSGGQIATDPQNTGLRIEWGLGYDSSTETGTLNEWTTSTTIRTPSGAVYLPENASATWFITGCQFEISPVATDFERCSFQKTLEYCQRYYERLDYAGGSMSSGIMGFYNNDVENFYFYHHRVPKRTTPTLEYSALSHFDIEPRDRSLPNLSIFRGDTKFTCLQAQNVTDDNALGEVACLTIDQSGGFIAFYAEM